MKRRDFLKTSATIGVTSGVAAAAGSASVFAADAVTPMQSAAGDRKLWTDTLVKIAQPVLSNLAAGTLQRNWPMEYSPTWDGRNKKCAYLEACGRLSMGLAPWLALGGDATPEGKQREQLASQLRAGIAHAVDWEAELGRAIQARDWRSALGYGLACAGWWAAIDVQRAKAGAA